MSSKRESESSKNANAKRRTTCFASERPRIVEPDWNLACLRGTVEFPLARPPFTGATIVRFHRPFSCGRLHNAWHWHLSRYTVYPLSFLISSLPHVARPLASASVATLYDVIKFFLHRTFAKIRPLAEIDRFVLRWVSRETPGTSRAHREKDGRDRNCETVIGRPTVWPPRDHPCVSPILHRYYCKLQLHPCVPYISVLQRNVRPILVEL